MAWCDGRMPRSDGEPRSPIECSGADVGGDAIRRAQVAGEQQCSRCIEDARIPRGQGRDRSTVVVAAHQQVDGVTSLRRWGQHHAHRRSRRAAASTLTGRHWRVLVDSDVNRRGTRDRQVGGSPARLGWAALLGMPNTLRPNGCEQPGTEIPDRPGPRSRFGQTWAARPPTAPAYRARLPRPPYRARPTAPALPRPPYHARPTTPALPRPPYHARPTYARPTTPALPRPPYPPALPCPPYRAGSCPVSRTASATAR